jgi:hypothetical protein
MLFVCFVLIFKNKEESNAEGQSKREKGKEKRQKRQNDELWWLLASFFPFCFSSWLSSLVPFRISLFSPQRHQVWAGEGARQEISLLYFFKPTGYYLYTQLIN